MRKITLKTLYRTKWCRKLNMKTLQSLINWDISYADYEALSGNSTMEKVALLQKRWQEEEVTNENN